MFIMKKLFAIALALILVLTCFAGCGSKDTTDMAAIKKAGKIVVGITDYAPMDYLDENGQWTGFDAEFAQMFAEELGVECEFYVIADWSKKFIELETKQIDAVWNGMTITDERVAAMSVSIPYLANKQVAITKKSEAASYGKTKDELIANAKDAIIIVEKGSAGEEIVCPVE